MRPAWGSCGAGSAAFANERLEPQDFVPRLRIDAPLGLRDISGDGRAGADPAGTVRHGQSEARVSRVAGRSVGAAQEAEGTTSRVVGQAVRADISGDGLAGRRAAEYLAANRFGLELAYSLNENEYRGERVTELTVADIRVPEVPA